MQHMAPLLQSVLVITLTLHFALRLLGEASIGPCDSVACFSAASSSLPINGLLGLCFAPLAVYFLMQDTALEAVIASLCIAWIAIPCTLAFSSPAGVVQIVAILLVHIPFSGLLLMDSQRQHLAVLHILKESQVGVVKAAEPSDETHATELRHMVSLRQLLQSVDGIRFERS